MREFFFSYRSKLDVAGHFASFGNSSPDTARIEEYARDPKGEIPYVDRLYHRTDIPELKQLYKETLLEMSQGIRIATAPLSGHCSTWSPPMNQ